MTVRMTADQFFGLTQRRLDQLHWPGNEGKEAAEVTMTVDQLQTIVATLQHIKATRQGEDKPVQDQGKQRERGNTEDKSREEDRR